MNLKQAKLICRGFVDKRSELMRDQKATAAYWNGDSWGSADGIEAAENWVNHEMAVWLMEQIRKSK